MNEHDPEKWLTNLLKDGVEKFERQCGYIISIGPPKGTIACTSDQLAKQGLVGAYIVREKLPMPEKKT